MYLKKTTTRVAMMATVGISALAMSSNAQAQSVTPVVDVCTGLSLDPSLVTDIVGETVQPVEDIETVLNGLVLSPLLSALGLPVLNSDLSTTLDNIANGNQLALTVLDTDGNIVTSSDACNVTADGYTLNQEAGIAIGGNSITGLGANGLDASAGELDAIAFGNSASTSVGATGAIAIGADSSVTQADGVALGNGASVTFANSVAIGAGSVTLRGAVSGYSSPGLAGTFDSAGEVSVGAPGAERQITNLAPGTEATDAATVGQVQGALDAVAALDDVAVQYDDGTYATVTLKGASGTTVTNVADGALNDTSTDAVNGSQLFATNQNVQVNADAITALDGRVTTNETDIANLDGRVTVNETDIANIDGRVTVNEGDIASLDGRVTVNEGDIANIDSRVTVNEGDIVAIDGRVTNNETAITNLQTQVANVPLGYVDDGDGTTPSSSPTQTVAMIGAAAGPVTLTNVAAGSLSATSSDAVNGSQLYATNQQVDQNMTNIAQNTADITNNANDIANNTANIATNATNIANNTANISQNTSDIQLIQNNLAGSTVVAVQYSDADNPRYSNGGVISQDVTLVGLDPNATVGLHNVADAVSDFDAVNLRQMQAGIDAALTTANAYTDMRFAEIAFDLDDVRRASYAGTAGALAVSGLPQVIESDGQMMAGAIGHYRGETAFAIGYSASSNDGRAVFKFNGTVDTHGYAGVSTGAGFAF